MNRCLTEGRQAFLERIAGIESGAECRRLAPLISKVADGEATPEEMRDVRPHLKSCLACKATLREYRATPARIAGLVPPVVAMAGAGGDAPRLLGRVLQAAHERFASLGDAAGAKVAAVAASAVVLAGGGAAGVDMLHHDAPPVAPSAYTSTPTPASPSTTDPVAAVPASTAPDPSTIVTEAVAQPASDPSPPTGASPSKPDVEPDPQPEFDPGTAASDQPAADPNEWSTRTGTHSGTSGSSTAGSHSPGSVPGEFGP